MYLMIYSYLKSQGMNGLRSKYFRTLQLEFTEDMDILALFMVCYFLLRTKITYFGRSK